MAYTNGRIQGAYYEYDCMKITTAVRGGSACATSRPYCRSAPRSGQCSARMSSLVEWAQLYLQALTHVLTTLDGAVRDSKD